LQEIWSCRSARGENSRRHCEQESARGKGEVVLGGAVLGEGGKDGGGAFAVRAHWHGATEGRINGVGAVRNAVLYCRYFLKSYLNVRTVSNTIKRGKYLYSVDRQAKKFVILDIIR